MAKLIFSEYNNINEFSAPLINLRERIHRWFYQLDGIGDNIADERNKLSEELCQTTERQLILQAIPICSNWFWHKECDYFIDIAHPLYLLEEIYDEELCSLLVEKVNLLSSESVVDSLRNHSIVPIVSELCTHVTNSIVYLKREESTIRLKAVLCSTIDGLIIRGSFFVISVLLEIPGITEIILSAMRCHIKYKYWLIGLELCVKNDRQTDIEKVRYILASLVLTDEYKRFEDILALVHELIGDHLMPRKQMQHLYKFHELVL